MALQSLLGNQPEKSFPGKRTNEQILTSLIGTLHYKIDKCIFSTRKICNRIKEVQRQNTVKETLGLIDPVRIKYLGINISFPETWFT